MYIVKVFKVVFCFKKKVKLNFINYKRILNMAQIETISNIIIDHHLNLVIIIYKLF